MDSIRSGLTAMCCRPKVRMRSKRTPYFHALTRNRVEAIESPMVWLFMNGLSPWITNRERLQWLESNDARPHPNPLPQGEGEQSRVADKVVQLTCRRRA